MRIGPNGPRWTGDARLIPEKLDEPLRLKPARNGRHRVFVNSMSDVFYEGFANEEIAAVFGVMAAAPEHDFLLLTKRAKRMREWFEWVASVSPLGPVPHLQVAMGGLIRDDEQPNDPSDLTRIERAMEAMDLDVWPLPNVWLGCSVEDQATADDRIPHLLETPAAVRWVSYEPALEKVVFGRGLIHKSACCKACVQNQNWCPACDRYSKSRPDLDWVVVGGESGPGAHPFDVEWARSVVGQCRAAGLPAFVKQLGARPYQLSGDGLMSNGEPPVGAWLSLRDRKGGAPEEWPADLRVREFPKGA